MSRFGMFGLGFALITGVLHVAGAFAPGPNAWGFHHYAFLPRPWLVMAALLMTVSFVPGVARTAGRRLGRVARMLEEPRTAIPVLAVAAALMVALFWLGRERTFFLSDGELLLRDVRRRVLSSFEADTLSAPFLLWLNTFFREAFGVDSWTASFRAASIGAGLVWILAMFAAVGAVSSGGLSRLFLGLFLLTSGVTRLFYGYVETSPLLAATVMVYVAASVRCLKTGRGIGAVVVALLVACMMHVTAFLLMPSFLLVAFRRFGRTARTWVIGLAPPVAALGTTLWIWSQRKRSFEGAAASLETYLSKFVPLTGPLLPKQAFTFFSWPHLTEFLNEQLVLGPFALLALIPVVLAARRPLVRNPAGARAFFLWMSAPFLALSILYNRELGGFRDWDLVATLAVPCLFLFGLAVVEDAASSGRPEALLRMALPVLAVSLVHLFGWVAVDTEPGRSIEQMTQVLGSSAPVSRFARAYGFEEIGRHYLERQDTATARTYFETAYAIDPSDLKAVDPLAQIHSTAGDWEKAVFYMRQAVRLRPGLAMAHFNLGLGLSQLGRTGEALPAYREAIRLDPDLIGAWKNLGALQFGLGHLDQADSTYRAAIARFPGSVDFHHNLGVTLENRNRFEEAVEAYRAALARDATYRPSAINLATLLMRMGRVVEGIEILEGLLTRDPRDQDAAANLAVGYAFAGRSEDAAKTLAGMAIFTEQTALACVEVARVMEFRGRRAEALALLQSCLARNEDLARKAGVTSMIESLH